MQVQNLWKEYASAEPSSRPPRREIHAKVDALWSREEAEAELWRLWESCWAQDPQVRPKIKDVVEEMTSIVDKDPTLGISLL